MLKDYELQSIGHVFGWQLQVICFERLHHFLGLSRFFIPELSGHRSNGQTLGPKNERGSSVSAVDIYLYFR
jgi:hypothetical protein